jgi:hypothetical protein
LATFLPGDGVGIDPTIQISHEKSIATNPPVVNMLTIQIEPIQNFFVTFHRKPSKKQVMGDFTRELPRLPSPTPSPATYR